MSTARKYRFEVSWPDNGTITVTLPLAIATKEIYSTRYNPFTVVEAGIAEFEIGFYYDSIKHQDDVYEYQLSQAVIEELEQLLEDEAYREQSSWTLSTTALQRLYLIARQHHKHQCARRLVLLESSVTEEGNDWRDQSKLAEIDRVRAYYWKMIEPPLWRSDAPEAYPRNVPKEKPGDQNWRIPRPEPCHDKVEEAWYDIPPTFRHANV